MKRAPTYFFISFLLLIPCLRPAFSQVNLDQLRKDSQQGNLPKTRVDALNKLAWELKLSDPKQAKACLKQSLAISEEITYPDGRGTAYNHLGTIFQFERELDSAEIMHENAMAVYNKANLDIGKGKTYNKLALVEYYKGNIDQAIVKSKLAIQFLDQDEKSKASTFTNLGVFYRKEGKYPEAIESYIEALKYFQKEGLTYQEAATQNNIGFLFFYQKQFEKAEEYHLLGLENARKAKSKELEGNALTGLGSVNKAKGEFDLARENFLNAVTLFEEVGQKEELAKVKSNLAQNYSDQGEIEKALTTYLECEHLFIVLGDSLAVGSIRNNRGELYFGRGDYPSSRILFLSALRAVAKFNDPTVLKSIYFNLAQTYEHLDSTELALVFTRKGNSIKDSLYNVESAEKIAEVERKYEVEETTAKLEKTRRNNRFLFGLSLFVGILLLLAAYFAFKSYRSSQELRAQQKKMIAKYNSLEQAYVEILEKLENSAHLSHPKEEGDKSIDFPKYLTELSKRELEVLSCLTVGMTDKDIANKLEISLSTIRTYCQRIYEKLQVRNRAEAANFARKYDLI